MKTSISEFNRQQGKHQVDQQRAGILEAAERLFLRSGLENTSMVDIAGEAGITRVTLYRYFPNRDAIAVEIQVRMLDQINAQVAGEPFDESLEGYRRRAQFMIRNFEQLRDAYRYIGMFDKIYLDHAPDAEVTRWTKQQLVAYRSIRGVRAGKPLSGAVVNEVRVVMNNIVWFLEKLALRGELTWSDKAIPLQEHLRVFEDLIMSYFDQIQQRESA